MLAPMFIGGFEVGFDAFFQHLSLLYGNMSSITFVFEYVHDESGITVDNPWVAGEYA
jgi:hypothetical protein